MSESTFTIPQLRQKLQETAADVRRTTVRTAWLELLWRWLALVAVLFVLDLLFGLPVWLRWITLVGQVGYVAWSVRGIMALQQRLGSEADWTARVVEERHPELDNALINAVQFERSLRGATPVQAALMQREIARGESAAATLPVGDAVSHEAERRALRLALALGGAWLAVAVLFSSGFMAVVPRLFLPWLDDVTPPYSLTRYEVRPPGATVRVGEGLNITVAISGPIPEKLGLMTRTRNTPWRRMTLESLETARYSVTLANLQEDTWFYVQGDGSRSGKYLIHVVSPPRVESLRATYTFPTYTGKPPATETLGESGIHGLVHTGVALEVTSNRPLQRGVLEIRTVDGNKKQVPLEIDGKNRARAVGKFAISRPGEFHVSLTSEEGQTTADAAKGKIVVEKDERPTVWFTQPGQDLLVTPDMRVLLLMEAEDDHAVQRVVLHRVVNDLGDGPQELPSPAPTQHVSHRLSMDLADLGVRPGDEIKYYATAYDNEPDHPNLGESDPFSIKVVTPEEYQEALKERSPEDVTSQPKDMVSAVQDLAERQEKLAKKMEQLQQELAKKPDDRRLQKELQDARGEQKALQEETRQLQQLMRDYAKSPSTSELEKALKKALGEMAQQMGSAADGAMQQAQEGSPGSSAEAARRAARQMQSLNRQMEARVQKSIEHLAQIMPLFQDMDRFLALTDRQGQLVLKAREFQQKTRLTKEDRARMAELEAEQTHIRQELKQLQEDLRAHADQAEEFFPKAARTARKIATEIDERQIPGLMAAAGDRFREPNGPEAFDRAQEAFQQMQAMIKECEGGQGLQGQAEGELDLCLSRTLGSKGLGRSLGQLSRGMGMGIGDGQGMGMGRGMGGQQSGPSGQSGGMSMRTAKAYVPGSAVSMGGTGGPKKHQSQNRTPGEQAALAPEDVEVMKNPAQKKPKAGDTDPNRYPVEYKKLISDYFKSVAEKQ